ncbi:sialin-like isoform X3 [Pieris brassicae]|uniref:sialin-like isoform X3 n=1 Tax=Pieris brassicae TaxID=7116 RepID=UPI001E661C48|nr:sialin-like isoform X3 [Pieris brassicae]
MIKICVRAIVGVMIFFGYFLVYIVRYNLSVHIVDMVELSRQFIIYNDTDILRTKAILVRSQYGMDLLNWNENKIALLLAAYHIGYCICFPIFHTIGDSFGPTWVVGVAGISSGVLNCLVPSAACFSFWLFFILRILNGFCAGAMLPSMIQVLRHWVPPVERHYFIWAYCGITTGTCSTFLICAAVQYYYKWSVGFYVCGAMQILWASVWLLVVNDSPDRHSFISKEEQSYLRDTIGSVFTIHLTNSQAPWQIILRSIPFWTVCILNFGYAWIIISLCLHGPIYYTLILGYSIYEASALTALPFLLRLILGTISIQSYFWYKQNTNIKRIKHIKKYFIVVSHVIPGVLISSAWLVPINPGPVLLTIAVALTAAGMDLTLDICYNTITVWRYVWSFHGSMLLICGCIFLLWGDTKTQLWNNIRHRPHRKTRLIIPPRMSNISEVDEDVNSIRTSTPKRSILQLVSSK